MIVFVYQTFSNLALVPGDGGTYFVSRVLGYAKAMELYLTARAIKSDEAFELGLINFLENSDTVWDKADELARAIASKPPVAVEMTKHALKESFANRNLESNLNLLSSFQAITQLSEDHQRGLRNLHQGNEKFEGN